MPLLLCDLEEEKAKKCVYFCTNMKTLCDKIVLPFPIPKHPLSPMGSMHLHIEGINQGKLENKVIPKCAHETYPYIVLCTIVHRYIYIEGIDNQGTVINS